MSRRMSCSLTIDAVRERRKTVTRRHVDTWSSLSVGDTLTLVEKAMGLPKGARQVVLADVVVVDVRTEPINLMSSDIRYGRQEVELEGFPGHDPCAWVEWWRESHGYDPDPFSRVDCRRIEWRYVS